jgi:hypothetical protein
VQVKIKITNCVVATTIISKIAGGKSSGISMGMNKHTNCIVHSVRVINRAKWVQSMTAALNAMIYSFLLIKSRRFYAIKSLIESLIFITSKNLRLLKILMKNTSML